MLVQNLAITYKCYASIGNSLDLKEMMYEVLRTFVSETYGVYAVYTVRKNQRCEELVSFGKIKDFDINNYSQYNESLNPINEKDRSIVLSLIKCLKT